jgi:Flp pilus assembly secretin CpaC
MRFRTVHLAAIRRSGRQFMLAALACLSLASAVRAETPEAESGIRVVLDQAKLVKLPPGTETVVIGNPAIADVTVQRGGVMVITGRSPGRTNFIALDNGGTIISESQVSVAAPVIGRVLVQRGTEQASYDCAPNCLPTVSLGDDDKHFNRAVSQTGARDGMANGSTAANAAKSEKK